MPRLSVLMPVRNGESSIRPAVLSTLRALPRDGELVVFDDSSSDSTLPLLEAIVDRRLRVIAGCGPSGVPGALNQLLAATDSELVARMDADDLCLPWRFRYQIAALASGAQAVFTTVVDWHSPHGRLRPHAPIGIGPEAFAIHLTLTNPVSHPTLLARRECLESVDGYRAVPAEDYDLWMRLQAAGATLRRLPLPSLGYRIHDNQVTASDQWRTSSWADPLIASAYLELTRRVLGRGYLRLNVLATSAAIDAGQFASTLSDFEEDVRRVAGRLGGERRFLLRVLSRRMAQVHALRARQGDDPISGDPMGDDEPGDESMGVRAP